MAENAIGAALGGEPNDSPEGEEASVAVGLDPAAAAAAMDAAKPQS